MKRLLPLLPLCCSLFTFAQGYEPYREGINSINELLKVPESSRHSQAATIFESLKKNNQIPLTGGDSVAFLYLGKATSVEWIGDFNGWGYDKSFHTKGTRLPGTDLWILKASFPVDARLDYKIVLNNRTWILDPNNPNQQWSGVGGGSPNSELRMPAYKDDQNQQRNEAIAHGVIQRDILYTSNLLGYQLTYSVYIPENEGKKLPIVYVTDGYEYLHPQLGNMVTVLDNLIAAKKIEPIIAVFIDHREPANRTNNRRMQELLMNENYLTFFTDEFIPYIETTYPVMSDPKHRAIMGASVGGLNATYFLFTRPDVFGMAGIQSPTFYQRPQIYSLCDPANTTITISITSGLINDANEGVQKMIGILENNACTYHYREVNQGQSWGNWKGLIDDILIDFFAPKK